LLTTVFFYEHQLELFFTRSQFIRNKSNVFSISYIDTVLSIIERLLLLRDLHSEHNTNNTDIKPFLKKIHVLDLLFF